MNIHYFSNSLIPSREANSIHVMKMCQAFAELGHNTVLHALPGDSDVGDVFSHYGVNSSFKLIIHDPEQSFLIRAMWFLRRNLPFIRIGPLPQIMHGWLIARQMKRRAMDANFMFGRHLFWLFGAATGKTRFMVEMHKVPSTRMERWVLNKVCRRPGFCGLVVISSALKKMYLENVPEIPNELILVAHDGADDVELDTLAASNEGVNRVGYVGHLYPGRGIGLIREMAAAMADVEFHLVGGTEADIAREKETGMPANMVLHGFVPHGELGDYFSQFDIMIAPYERKVSVAGGAGDTSAFMSPLKIFEYMAWGKPIVASDMSALREVLEDGVTALLVPPEDADSWVRALSALKNNREQRNSLGKNARNLFLQKYTWKGRAKEILAQVN